MALWSWLPKPFGGGAAYEMQPARAALFALTSSLDLSALVLLFLPVSNDWFRALRRNRKLAGIPEGKRGSGAGRKSGAKSGLWLDRWLAPYTPKTLTLSLVSGLILAWVAGMLAAATWAGMDSFLGLVAALYSMTCFPVQIALLAVGAGLGAWIGKRNGDLWRGGTLGAWIAIPVAMMVGLVGGLALRNSNW